VCINCWVCVKGQRVLVYENNDNDGIEVLGLRRNWCTAYRILYESNQCGGRNWIVSISVVFSATLSWVWKCLSSLYHGTRDRACQYYHICLKLSICFDFWAMLKDITYFYNLLRVLLMCTAPVNAIRIRINYSCFFRGWKKSDMY